MDPTTPKPDLTWPALTIPELSALLRIAENTLYLLAKNRELPGAYKFGNSYRIHGPTVLACMTSGQAPSLSKRRAR